MGRTVTEHVDRRHPVLPDMGRPVMAKADVRDPDIDWMQAIGAAIQQAVKDAGFSNKEAAREVGVDDAEFGKWLSGTRRPQFDRLMSVPALRLVLVVNLAKLDGKKMKVQTVITVEAA